MAHIGSIGASIFTDLSVAVPLTPLSTAAAADLDSALEFQALFAKQISNIGGTKSDTDKTFVRIQNIREFPSIGVPPNIVNVPTYGQSTSQQIQGQADAPNMEITVNLVAADWAKTSSILGDMVGDGNIYAFRFTLLNKEPQGTDTVTKYASTAAGIGTVPNSQWYFVGKIDSLLVNPQLTDATTATIAITLNSAIRGAYTI